MMTKTDCNAEGGWNMFMTLAHLSAGMLAAGGAAFIYRYRKAPGAKPFFALNGLLALAVFASNLETLSVAAEAKLLWRGMQQAAYLFVPVALLMLAMAYTSFGRYMNRRVGALLGIVPAAGAVLLATDGIHGWMHASLALDDAGRILFESNPLHDCFVLYGVLLLLTGLVMLVRGILFTRGKQRRQLAVLAFCLALPFMGGLLQVAGWTMLDAYWTYVVLANVPASILLMGILYKYQMLQAVPIPRNKLFDVMSEGLVVLDSEARVLDQNEAAKLILSGMADMPARQLLGRSIIEQIPAFEAVLMRFKNRRETMSELSYQTTGGERHLAVKLTPVSTGAVLSLTDVTELRRLEREWMVKASTDGLTGIYNRTGYMDRTAQVWEAAAVSGEPVSLLLMDIDDFKAINDCHGHQTGDTAICTFVESVLRVVDMPFLFGRVGGEEFALTLPGRGKRQAYELAERIRQTVESSVMLTPGAGELRYTVSIGIACRGVEDTAFDKVYAKADQLLYKAKQNGRNQTQIA
jgi:diguanylate cyclase (GGDEF)-like protein